MNLAERMAANDDYGYDEDSVHTLLKKHEVCYYKWKITKHARSHCVNA
jgi:hypothetical protein